MSAAVPGAPASAPPRAGASAPVGTSTGTGTGIGTRTGSDPDDGGRSFAALMDDSFEPADARGPAPRDATPVADAAGPVPSTRQDDAEASVAGDVEAASIDPPVTPVPGTATAVTGASTAGTVAGSLRATPAGDAEAGESRSDTAPSRAAEVPTPGLAGTRAGHAEDLHRSAVALDRVTGSRDPLPAPAGAVGGVGTTPGVGSVDDPGTAIAGLGATGSGALVGGTAGAASTRASGRVAAPERAGAADASVDASGSGLPGSARAAIVPGVAPGAAAEIGTATVAPGAGPDVAPGATAAPVATAAALDAAPTPEGGAAAVASAAPRAETGPAASAASATPRPDAATALDSPSAGDELAASVRTLSESGRTSARIDVTPATLGPVRIELERDADRLGVSLHAAQPLARELLEALAPRLRELLAGDGAEVRVSVGDDGRSEGRGDARGDGRGDARQDPRQDARQDGARAFVAGGEPDGEAGRDAAAASGGRDAHGAPGREARIGDDERGDGVAALDEAPAAVLRMRRAFGSNGAPLLDRWI